MSSSQQLSVAQWGPRDYRQHHCTDSRRAMMPGAKHNDIDIKKSSLLGFLHRHYAANAGGGLRSSAP